MAPEQQPPPNSRLARASKVRQDAEKLLTLAELLQDKCDLYERRIALHSGVAGLVLVLVTTFVLFIIPVLSKLDNSNSLWPIVASLVYGVAALGYIIQRLVKLKREARRDKLALLKIVDMLREVIGTIARKSKLSTLERAAMQIRLSRFDIGYGLYDSEARRKNEPNRIHTNAHSAALGLRILAGLKLTDSERASLPPSILAYLALQKSIILTRAEKDRLCPEELAILGLHEPSELNEKDWNRLPLELQHSLRVKGQNAM